jgi:DNA-binding transcriptional MerR regulator
MAANAAQKSPEAFRTISEVATELEVPQHVLRFWETKFAPVKPLKRGGGRRYYRPDDLDLLRGIRALLYADGLTIKGVQKILREQGPRYVMEIGRGDASLMPPPARTPAREANGAERGAKQPRLPTCILSRAKAKLAWRQDSFDDADTRASVRCSTSCST